ncbi:hypothetical protein [Chamaesiphon sp. VAR_69_metabat_338]|uniref:hypothetical protein n=1 Tax=Chamaesiphon sp. VAR_69_metabat_338 TaxID=2964704 RepID=UPI00286DE865|nr:hypothetical protein [Chamaesiphon sp. VAR_69_metabat_338]
MIPAAKLSNHYSLSTIPAPRAPLPTPNSQLPVLSRYTVGEPDEREPQLPTPN